MNDRQADGDLASIRNPEALDNFPAEEQTSCRKVWAYVDALLSTAWNRTP